VLVSEWVVVVYVAYLVVVAAVRPVSGPSRIRLFAMAALTMTAIFVVASLPPSSLQRGCRTWLPLAYALLGYWMAGLLFHSPQERFERQFMAFDRRVWPRQAAFVRAAPRIVLEYFELAYLAAYPIAPAALATILIAGRADLADRFWSTLLLSVLGCYAVLPWIRTRPPWVLKADRPIDERPLLLRRVNMFFVRNASTCANTFPSGHAAGAVAGALVATQAWPAAGAWFLPAAISVAVATVVGDYHYIGDAALGVVVAVLVWLAVVWAGV